MIRSARAGSRSAPSWSCMESKKEWGSPRAIFALNFNWGRIYGKPPAACKAAPFVCISEGIATQLQGRDLTIAYRYLRRNLEIRKLAVAGSFGEKCNKTTGHIRGASLPVNSPRPHARIRHHPGFAHPRSPSLSRSLCHGDIVKSPFCA